MNVIAFMIESLLMSFGTALLIDFVRTGYGFTQGNWVWFDTYWSSWGFALAIHAVEFSVKAFKGSFEEDDERPEPDFFIQGGSKPSRKDYGAPLQ